MITFTKEMKVEKVEEKTITKRDGEPFEFTEALLSEGDKRKTYLVARVKDDIKDLIREGSKLPMEIEITSWKRDDGKVWNNFVVKNVQNGAGKWDTMNQGDEIPF